MTIQTKSMNTMEIIFTYNAPSYSPSGIGGVEGRILRN